MNNDADPVAGQVDNSGNHRGLITGVVLAGGLSRRMGGIDKTMITLGGKAMIVHAIEKLDRQCGPLVINANGDPDRFNEFGHPVVADIIPDYAGPLAGILTGMRWSLENAPKAKWIVTVAADTPFLPDDLVVRLLSATGHDFSTIALACSGTRIHPVAGLWPVALADALEEFLRTENSRKVLAFVDRFTLVKVEFGGSSVGGTKIDPFFNVNTPEELDIAEAILAEKEEV